MRAFAYFILLMLVSLLLSALLNHPLYGLLQESMSKGPHKLINTVAKLIAIPGFILILRHFAINNKIGLGYGLPRSAFVSDLLKGWLSGLSILLLLSAGLFLFGVRSIDFPTEAWLPLLLKTTLVALIGGLLIGFIEETFFRGGLFGAIRRDHGFVVTMLLSSLFYAGLHFIDPPPLAGAEAQAWYSGLLILSGAFSQFAEWRIFDSFVALFGLGVFFAVVRERTGNIAYCIGLHAGFVFVIKTVRKFSDLNPDSAFSFLVGSYDGMIGYLSAAGLLIHTLLVYRFWRRPKAAQACTE
ncbi:CPBP family intramembrane glutamic endopeptidase [Sedimenticola hydrogenitrophicus]|uniref:CPBP family intramembrane glutamic endopeptidase n=1 Tax=Sedimenticola hydrogenitrophicus TaxID=2967975 RepID=UPI0023B1F9DF|nr:CPBP family intramembrane glutamic endopeptidase [Sedimenticola hydrogenitrophicus]